MEFKPFPKIARLNRDIVVTEKIDGINAAIGIADEELLACWETGTVMGQSVVVNLPEYAGSLLVYAQSRNRIITPEDDNSGLARWVRENAVILAATLGAGIHFGEWWGSGIKRGYSLPKGEKRFSLFNTKRWGTPEWVQGLSVPGLGVVPVLYQGPFHDGGLTTTPWDWALTQLRRHGSAASPGFMRPEGVVVYHTAANSMFKVTLENDEAPKSLAGELIKSLSK